MRFMQELKCFIAVYALREPVDTKLKDPVRTHWLDDDKVDKLEEMRKSEDKEEQKDWWEEEGDGGYSSELEHVDWDWDNDVYKEEIYAGYGGRDKQNVIKEEEGGEG